MEIGAELGYPVSETLTAGGLNAAAQLAGTVIVTVFQEAFLRPEAPAVEGMRGAWQTNVAFVAVMCVGLVLVLAMRGELNRKKEETQMAAEQAPPPPSACA